MTWAASIHTDEAGLRVRFDKPVQVVTMTREKARELAALLLVAAETEITNTAEHEVETA